MTGETEGRTGESREGRGRTSETLGQVRQGRTGEEKHTVVHSLNQRYQMKANGKNPKRLKKSPVRVKSEATARLSFSVISTSS